MRRPVPESKRIGAAAMAYTDTGTMPTDASTADGQPLIARLPLCSKFKGMFPLCSYPHTSQPCAAADGDRWSGTVGASTANLQLKS